MKRSMRAASEPPSAPPSSFGGYYKNARNVASLKAQTAAEMLLALGLAGGSVYGAVQLDALWPLAAGGVAVLLVGVHAAALREHTEDVVADLWRHEMSAGRDLDGDGVIGAPPQRVTRYINIGGQLEPFVDEDAPQPVGAPVVIDLVPGFEMSPADLADVVELAEQVGLGRAKLVGTRLPSGAKFSKGNWERFTREAARRGWVEPGRNGAGGRWLVRPASIRRALLFSGGETGRADRETGRAGERAGCDWFESGETAGEGGVAA